MRNLDAAFAATMTLSTVCLGLIVTLNASSKHDASSLDLAAFLAATVGAASSVVGLVVVRFQGVVLAIDLACTVLALMVTAIVVVPAGHSGRSRRRLVLVAVASFPLTVLTVVITLAIRTPFAGTGLKPIAARVKGTCANAGRCGLNRRKSPTPDAAIVGGKLPDGQPVHVMCQRFGGLVRSAGGRRSDLWDLLDDETWVSDLFLDTSKQGPTAKEVPTCPANV